MTHKMASISQKADKNLMKKLESVKILAQDQRTQTPHRQVVPPFLQLATGLMGPKFQMVVVLTNQGFIL